MSETTTTRAAEHYSQLLAEAIGDLPIAQVVIPFQVTDIDGLEVTNVECGKRHEAFELGPDYRNQYVRICSPDNAALAAKLRALADDLLDATMDERERQAEAERHDCFCGVRLDPDDDTCGSVICLRKADAERYYDSLGLI